MSLILVVDDDADIVRTIKSNLMREGYQVICASNGYEACQSSLSHLPDLVLLDIVMPGIDGIEVCRQLRTNPATASMPILFATVSGDIESKVAAFVAGADDYLVKPFDLQELNLRVKALLLREESGVDAYKGSD
jgi:DNA-binding response OmpR family regulator